MPHGKRQTVSRTHRDGAARLYLDRHRGRLIRTLLPIPDFRGRDACGARTQL